MLDIKVNQSLYDHLSPEDLNEITQAISESGILKGESFTITADPDALLPELDEENSELLGEALQDMRPYFRDSDVMAKPQFKIKGAPCRALCNAAAAAIVAALSLTGAGLAAAVAVIAVAKEECLKKCDGTKG